MHAHHSPFSAVRLTGPYAIFIFLMQMNTWQMLEDTFLPKDLHHLDDVTFFYYFAFRGEKLRQVCVIGGLMAAKRYGSPPLLAPGQNDGSGWLAVRKHHLGVTGDTFIEPVKLPKAMSWTGTSITITHTRTGDGGRVFNITWSQSCASIKRALCVTLGFRAHAETDVSDVRRQGPEFYFTNTARIYTKRRFIILFFMCIAWWKKCAL